MLFPVLLMLLFMAAFSEKLAQAVEGAAYNPSPLYYVTLLCIFATGAGGYLIGYCIARYIGSTLPTIWTLEQSIRLVPIQGTTTTFLSRGSRFYTYRRELGRTTSQPGTLSAQADVDIRYGYSEGWMEKYVDKLIDGRHSFFAIPSKKTRYEFLVPEGSVVTNLDLSKATPNKAMA